MNWEIGTALIKGKSAITIKPNNNATRAEFAASLQRFIAPTKYKLPYGVSHMAHSFYISPY